MTITQDLLTKHEVAIMLKVHPRTIHRLYKSGKLTGFRVTSRVLRFRKDDVDTLLSSSRNQEQPNSSEALTSWIQQQTNRG